MAEIAATRMDARTTVRRVPIPGAPRSYHHERVGEREVSPLPSRRRVLPVGIPTSRFAASRNRSVSTKRKRDPAAISPNGSVKLLRGSANLT